MSMTLTEARKIAERIRIKDWNISEHVSLFRVTVVLDDRITELEKKLAEHITYSNAMRQDREAAVQRADEADMEVGKLKAQRDELLDAPYLCYCRARD